jgi:hypothetical protein
MIGDTQVERRRDAWVDPTQNPKPGDSVSADSPTRSEYEINRIEEMLSPIRR